MLGNSSLQWSGVSSNYCGGQNALICHSNHYQWLEGKLNGDSAGGSASVGVLSGQYERVHLISIQNIAGVGLGASSNSLYDQIQVSNTSAEAINGYVAFATFFDISANTFASALRMEGATSMVFNRFSGSNIGAWGVVLQATSSNVVSNSFSQITLTQDAGGGGTPVFMNYANAGRLDQNNNFSHMTFLNSNMQFGIPVMQSGAAAGTQSNNTYADILISNMVNPGALITTKDVNNESFYDLLLQGSPGNAIGIENNGNTSTNVNFDGSIRVKGNATNCSNTVPSFKLNGGCNYGPTLAKTAITSGFDLSNSFQGIVSSDPINQSIIGRRRTSAFCQSAFGSRK